MSETTYAVVTVTDHRWDPPREFHALTWWRDARERRCGIAGAASGAFRTQMSAGPAFEVHWGNSEWAPAQIFIGDQFAADLEVRSVDAEHYESLVSLLAGESGGSEYPDEDPEPELVAEGVPFGDSMPAFYGGGHR